MQVNISEILNALDSQSVRPMENRQRIQRYFMRSIDGGDIITLFNWECPPRTLRIGKSGPYLNYDVDLDKIFHGELVDAYTEVPRVVEQKNREIRLLDFLSSLGIKYRFVKIIADSNAYYLSPQSLMEQGEPLIRSKFDEFQSRISAIVRGYPIAVQVLQFMNLIEQSKKLYDEVFQAAYSGLQTGGTLLAEDVVALQYERTKKHIGTVGQAFMKDFSIRTIASYGAEGVVFKSLAETPGFSNCIWLNIEEVDERTIQITNFMRRQRNLEPMPMLFLR